MRMLTAIIGAAACLVASSAAQAQSAVRDDCAAPTEAQTQSGCKLLDDFLLAFNEADPVRFAASNHYPHIRITGPKVVIWNSAEEYMRDNPAESMKAKDTDTKFKGWKKSRWDWRRLVQSSATSMHYAVAFTRLDGNDKPLATFESLYVITKSDAGWGIQARSSFAGIANGGAY